MDPFIGQIIMFGGTFAPRGWAFCEGQLLPISQYTAMFSILGTIYGGDGRTTFGLPDLRGRAAFHAGHGPGLTTRSLGQKSGGETNTLNSTQLPAIPLKVSSANASQTVATAGASIATPGTTIGRTFTPTEGYNAATPDVALNAGSLGGNRQAVNNVQPYLVVSYIIALEGTYPSRS